MWKWLAYLLLLTAVFSWRLAMAIAGVAVVLGVIILKFVPDAPPKFPTPEEAEKLAQEAASLLEQGMRIADSHPYYCGVGIVCIEGLFIYDVVQDGEIDPPGMRYQNADRREFADRNEFIQWLTQRLVSQPLDISSSDEISFTRVQQTISSHRKFSGRH
jgi:hypothetical protein